LKSHDSVVKKLVGEWIAKAEEDYRLVEYLCSGQAAFWNATGYHAQQAAEKYLKALLVHQQVVFPKTHDIDLLIEIASSKDPELCEQLPDVSELAPYGVQTRYPGNHEPISADDAAMAFAIVSKLRTTILGHLTVS
jgi:HEPN domain-containing protein